MRPGDRHVFPLYKYINRPGDWLNILHCGTKVKSVLTKFGLFDIYIMTLFAKGSLSLNENITVFCRTLAFSIKKNAQEECVFIAYLVF